MQPEIVYKSIRHGYARINKEGNLQLCIPSRLRNDQKFYADLLAQGEKLMLRYQKKQQVEAISSEHILLFGESVERESIEVSAKKLPAELKSLLYEYALPILEKYSQELGISYRDLKIKKVRSKRGSCTYNQHILLNQDLVHLPTRLIKYVIIHEACHLKIKNHSTKFRSLVESFCPNYKLLRKELKNIVFRA